MCLHTEKPKNQNQTSRLCTWLTINYRNNQPRSVDIARLNHNQTCCIRNLFMKSFIHSEYFCSTFQSQLLLRGAPDTARILCRRFTPKHHRQLRVKDLPKVPTWRARAGFKPTTLRTKAIDSTNAPPSPTEVHRPGLCLKDYRDNDALPAQ